MPVIQVKTNTNLNDAQKQQLLLAITRRVAEIMGKPVSDIMVLYSGEEIMMGETSEPAAFVDLRFISGLNMSRAKALCEALKNVINETVVIAPTRLYINFPQVDGVRAWRFIDHAAVCSESI